MGNIIGVSAYNLNDDTYEYNENECFIADSVESLRDFLKGAGFPLEEYRAVNVDISDIMKDYGVSSGRYCMEPEALKRFEKAALSHGITCHLEEYDEGLVNVKVDLPRIEETEAEETDAKLAPWIQKIDVESLNNLTGEMRADLLSEINYNKGYEERLAQYRLDKKDVLEGLLVSYTNIVSDRGSIACGGKDATFRFLHKGHEYLVDDLYCPNPNCNCRKIYLLFFEQISDISGYFYTIYL